MKLMVIHKLNSAHFLPNYPGKCRNLHGHTWKVEVTLEGEVDPQTGMLEDFHLVQVALDTYDHCLLNDFKNLKNPTAENFARELVLSIPHATKVRLWESDVTYAEITIVEALGFVGKMYDGSDNPST